MSDTHLPSVEMLSRSCGARVQMKPQSRSLFSLLFLLLLPHPSRLYSFKKCSTDLKDQSRFVCSSKELPNIPTDIPKSATGINLQMNKIQSIRRTDLIGFYKLEILNLDLNKISHIEDGAFSDLSALTQLTLALNNLRNLNDNMFTGLSNLSDLIINDNQIISISKFAFKPLHKLHTLYLSFNYLVSSDIANILMHCPSLEILYLAYNNLTSFEYYNLPFPSLKTLNLVGNNITVFEPDKSPFLFMNLTELDLDKNPLRRLSVHSDVFPHLNSLGLASMMEPVIEWDVSNKDFFRGLSKLELLDTSFDIRTYQLLFKLVDSVDNLNLDRLGRLIDKVLLDFACSIPSLQKLSLGWNNISILNDSLLQSCANLTKLDLGYNSMTDLTEASLQMLTRLITLNLDSNHFSRIPVAIRNMTTLKHLSFDQNKITELQCFDFLNLISLRKLSLANNAILKISSCVFRSLPNLEILNVANNRLLQLTFDGTLTKLRSLLVGGNNIGLLLKGTFHNMSSLTYLNFFKDNSAVTALEAGAFEGLYNLTELDLSTNSFSGDTFAGLPKLERLFLSLHNPVAGSRSSSGSLYLPSLQNLEVKVNSRACLPQQQDVLKGLGNLTTFKSTNFFCETPHQNTFIYSPHLEELSIANSEEFDALPELFHPLKQLKTLHLTYTNIKSVDFLSNANLTRLEVLSLTNNEIKLVNETIFKALPSLKHVDLSGNPFACNCSNDGFIDWVIRNKQVQVVNAFQYRCSSPPSEEGNFLLDFNVQSCWEFTGFLCFISSSALVLVTLLSSFTYHFLRWQLVYGYYLLLAFLYDSKKRRQGCPYIYDAFVSYNVHDEDWVYRELLPELERVQGWRLCLHHCDFQPGKPIMENITDAIYSSRKTLCVISRRYLQSEWCSQEIQMASYRLFDEQKDVLILLFLEEISSNQLSPFYRMRKLVKSRTYLSWTQARNHRGLFWEKVQRALECDNEPADSHNPLTANVY
ncbi:toll-like receptor 13 [Boleophthalmus pectinirostris]|uniref:toll-like receptor 13 n=1 Tax=Boleophthalmus pectinirostris TaxID=150288 RepID=UPI002432BE9D|nr:toll-like receptor 13 [Boleophthalmus pectinirostris]